MAANKRNRQQIEADRLEMNRLALAGVSQAEIAGQFGVSQPQVAYDLSVVRQRWKETTNMDLENTRNRELALLDKVEECAWSGWEHAERDGDTGGASRFALIILKASDQRAALLNLPGNPPTFTAPADDAGRQQRLERIRAAFAAKVLRDYCNAADDSNASDHCAELTNGGTPLPTKPTESVPKPQKGYTMS